LIPVEVYPQHDTRQLANGLCEEPLNPAVEGYGVLGAQALREIRARTKLGPLSRSAVTQMLDLYRDRVGSNSDALRHLDEIEAWYSRVRYRGLARQHGAQFVQLLDERRAVGPFQRWCESLIARKDAHAGSRIELPEEIITGLAEMDDEDWRRFVGDHRRSLNRWWQEGSTDELKAVIDGLGKRVASKRTTNTLFGMVLPDAALVAGMGTVASLTASDLGASGRVVAAAGSLTATAATVVLANTGQATVRRVQHRMLDVAHATTS
jgi:hypothetical protein